MPEDNNFVDDRMRLSVITAREPVANNPWITERWRVAGVMVSNVSDRGRTPIYSGADGTHYLWPGFELRLYRHETESYYRNLLGEKPSVYVVCQVDESGELIPVETSADYAEAGARREAGDEVAPVPMPPEVSRWMAAYVAKYFVPEEAKTMRKRPGPQRAAGPRQYEPND